MLHKSFNSFSRVRECAKYVCPLCSVSLGKKIKIEKVDLFSLFIKWEQDPPSNSILLVTFAFKPAAENDTAEYVSRFYHSHSQMAQKQKKEVVRTGN